MGATTITTVGYGDRYPTTAAGRIVAFGLMLSGIALLGVVTATLASWIIDPVREENQAERAATWAQVEALMAEVRLLRVELDPRIRARPGRRQLDRPDAFRRHGRHLPAPAPLVLDDVLDVRPLAAAVVADPPGPLGARPPPATVLDLYRARWVEAALLKKPNRHSTDVAQRAMYLSWLAQWGVVS